MRVKLGKYEYAIVPFVNKFAASTWVDGVYVALTMSETMDEALYKCKCHEAGMRRQDMLILVDNEGEPELIASPSVIDVAEKYGMHNVYAIYRPDLDGEPLYCLSRHLSNKPTVPVKVAEMMRKLPGYTYGSHSL